ncbi:MAG: hypothetical protein AAF662_11440 [Pseudomonadota bacterium]
MSAKTERITILGSPEFKAYLNEQAAKAQISVSQYVRRQCEQPTATDDEEALLRSLIATLDESLQTVEANLDHSLATAAEVLSELRAKREAREVTST